MQDPQSFVDNREDTYIVEADASALWLKLRGEEPVMLCDSELEKNQNIKTVKRWHQQAETLSEKYLIHELIQQVCDDCKDIKPQTDEMAAQGGDKHRITIINLMAKKNWFKPGTAPEGFMLPAIVIVNAQHHARPKSRSTMW